MTSDTPSLLMASYWPHVTEADNLVAQKLNGRPKHVASRTLEQGDWQHSSIIHGDVARAVEQLKAREGGELQVHGSWQLVQHLHQLGLVDEYRVLTFPVVVGAGKRLFDDAANPTTFELLESRTTGTGATYSVLRPNGEPVTGTFSVEDGAEVTTVN